ncbi:MAG TPA: methyltransferase type 11 [Anaeromyxobacteraceae bacterium]|nr:methyltransferase type 11 [Anaeromyxobacteraceae bacterium]
MAPFYSANGAGEILPRYSFLEPLLQGRRVLELGAAGATDGASAVFLAERGAAAVLSLDAPEAVERAAQAAHHPFVQFRSMELASLPAGAFDLVVIADGSALAADPGRVAELRALLAEDGLLLAALRAPGGAGLLAFLGERPPGADQVPSYESFAGALAAEFEVVEMATQSAVVGYVLARSQAGDDPAITVDGSLAGPSEAAYYLAICGAEPCGLEGLTLVALPPRPLADAAVASDEAARAHQGCLAAAEAGADTESLRRAVAEREDALVAKDVELAEALARTAEGERLAAEKDARLAELEVDAEAGRVRADGVTRELEQEREARFEAQAALDRARAALGEAEAQREALGVRLRELEGREEASGRAAEEVTRLGAELEIERAARAEAEASGQAARAEAQAARAGVESILARVEGAEARAAELEQALDDARRREEEARAEAESRAAALEVRSAELEMRTAEQEARVAELEAELARGREALAGREAEVEEARRGAAAAEEAQGRLAEVEAEREALRAEVAAGRAALEAAEARVGGAEELAAQAEARARTAEEEGARRAEETEARVRTAEEEGARRAEETEARLSKASEEAARAADELERLRQQVEEQSLERARFETEAVAARGAAEAAEGQAASLEAELQAVRWERDELEQRLQSTAQGTGSAGEVGRLREELAARAAEIEAVRSAAERSAAEAAAAAARADELEARMGQAPGQEPGEERVRELEARLAEALRHEADSEALAQAARAAAGGQATEVTAAMERLAQERDTYAAQIAERDARLARLQRELSDKTERLGRLAQEVGELKSKGLGKLFTR